MRRLIPFLAFTFAVAACGTDAADTTTTRPTVPPATTSTSTSTTTTIDVFDVAINSTAPGNLGGAIADAYLYAGDAGVAPAASDGFARHLSGGVSSGDIVADFEVTTAELAEGWVAVGIWEDDVLLATSSDGEAWTLVGGRLTSMGLTPYYGESNHRLFIIGSDARSKEDPLTLRADSLHIVSVASDGSSASIVGLPRDTYVETSYGGKTKFTNVMSGRGPETVVATGELLTGLEFDGYMLTAFAGFVRIVDKFGGFEIDIPFDMAERKSKAYFSAGLQLIDGQQALAFARNRTLSGGDFTRSFHHGVIMQWGLSAVIGRGLLDVPENLQILGNHTFTDLSVEKRLLVLAALFELDAFEIPNIVVDGTSGTAGSASVVFLNDGAFDVFEDLADGVLDNVDG